MSSKLASAASQHKTITIQKQNTAEKKETQSDTSSSSSEKVKVSEESKNISSAEGIKRDAKKKSDSEGVKRNSSESAKKDSVERKDSVEKAKRSSGEVKKDVTAESNASSSSLAKAKAPEDKVVVIPKSGSKYVSVQQKLFR